MFLFFYFLIPGLYGELSELTNFISTGLFDNAEQLLNRLDEIDQRFNLKLADMLTEYYTAFTKEAPALVQQILKDLANFSMSLVSKAWISVMLIFLVFYLVQDLEKAKANLTLLAPQIYKDCLLYTSQNSVSTIFTLHLAIRLHCLFLLLGNYFLSPAY